MMQADKHGVSGVFRLDNVPVVLPLGRKASPYVDVV
jgi:hypothetical protein